MFEFEFLKPLIDSYPNLVNSNEIQQGLSIIVTIFFVMLFICPLHSLILFFHNLCP
jgi:hypothetical protein